MRILIIDNYDSFTYNLYHYVEKCGVEVDVIRNDELVLEEVDNYDKLILSPGPGLPSETKMMFELLSHYFSTKPILGVCLGMQGIAEFFNARLVNQKKSSMEFKRLFWFNILHCCIKDWLMNLRLVCITVGV